MHDLIFGSDINDLTGALSCAIGYHTYHSLKFGKMPEIRKAIETGTFRHVRACAYSAAKAFMNDFDIQSNGTILKCGRHLYGGRNDQHRDVAYGYQAGTLVGSPVPLAPDLTHSPDQAILTVHSQSFSSSDH